jgi:hypothetical protein
MKRPYASFLNTELESKINELVTIRDVEQLELIYSELKHRRKPQAKALMARLKLVLESLYELSEEDEYEKTKTFLDNKDFGETLKFWRTYCKRSVEIPKIEDACFEKLVEIEEFWNQQERGYFELSDIDLKDLELKPKDEASFFSYFGYRTDRSLKLRKQILHLLQCCSLPKTLKYRDWGKPSSKQRYLKIIGYLSGFAFPHKNNPRQADAVAAWDADRKWFESSYHTNISD